LTDLPTFLTDVGAELAEAIDHDGRTLRDIAKAAEVSEGTVYRVLRGQGCGLAALYALAEALGCPVLDLIPRG